MTRQDSTVTWVLRYEREIPADDLAVCANVGADHAVDVALPLDAGSVENTVFGVIGRCVEHDALQITEDLAGNRCVDRHDRGVVGRSEHLRFG